MLLRATGNLGFLWGDSLETSLPWVFGKRHIFTDPGIGAFLGFFGKGWKPSLLWVLAGEQLRGSTTHSRLSREGREAGGVDKIQALEEGQCMGAGTALVGLGVKFGIPSRRWGCLRRWEGFRLAIGVGG